MKRKQTRPECGELLEACEECGSCAMFTNEDFEGYGYCEFHQEPRRCSDYCEDRIQM